MKINNLPKKENKAQTLLDKALSERGLNKDTKIKNKIIKKKVKK